VAQAVRLRIPIGTRPQVAPVLKQSPALELRVAADCIDHGEKIPEPFTKVFSVA
jgi:hypothetical protein